MGIGGFLMHWLNLGTDSQQSYSFMRRHSLLLAFMIFCALMLTACVRDTAKESVSALLAHPTSENAHPDFPEVMEPNPKDPNFSFFDPCTDVPAEIYERAGIIASGLRSPQINDYKRSYCHYRFKVTPDPPAVIQIGADVLTYSEASNSNEVLIRVKNIQGVPAGVYFTSGELGEEDYECTATMPTSRGRIWVSHLFFGAGNFTREDACPKAWEILKEITRGI
ncbi:DUF3558 domain-containing protein [Corynebacterium pseudotuberculosis]|uniref:DUF3558 family protein n=1 Tax=Corynebacterium pseudotuberculosis TaxID=1719 RepID=UPI0020C8D09B|nr:DUF3558 family protein [Corynebacterium pseudotuberculosis]UTO23955.1 DUF3558 domain-containing protein [Corynebacterium pseudotuberculosis]